MPDERLPHLYKKLLELMRRKDTGAYLSRRALHRQVASGYRVNKADIDIAMKELHSRKVVRLRRASISL